MEDNDMFKGGGTSIKKLGFNREKDDHVSYPTQGMSHYNDHDVPDQQQQLFQQQQLLQQQLLQYQMLKQKQIPIEYFRIIENASWKESIIVVVIVLLTTNNFSHQFQNKFIPEMLKNGNYMNVILSAILSGIVFFIISNFFMIKK